MPSTIHFTPDFIKACEEIWRDGFNKGVNGEDSFPDFKEFFKDTKSKIKVKEEPSYEELEKLPFNPSKCEARVEKYGFAIQCTRTPFGSGCLCKTHQNMLDKLPEGKDIRYGRFNQPRPDVTLDKGEPIKWGPKGSRSKNKSPKSQPKLKVGEMRDYLSSRIPVTDFKGLKKKELTELYLKVRDEENKSESSDEGENSPINSPKIKQPEEQQSEQSDDNNIADPIPEEDEQQNVEEQHEQTEEEQPEQTVEEQHEQTVEEQHVEQPEQPEQPEEQEKEQTSEEQPEDDGKGTGLKLEPVKPKTVTEFKKLFDSLGIDYSSFKGRGAYKQAYEDYLKEQEEEEEKTQPMSDEEDDDELQEDKNSYVQITFEGSEYLEDEDSGNIYDLSGKNIAKWNEDSDDFIWKSEEAKTAHENKRS
tara:strand:+ start:218 stop:1468 length:1251 start_codon:yes stop_codon:yes gene_type:complete